MSEQPLAEKVKQIVMEQLGVKENEEKIRTFGEVVSYLEQNATPVQASDLVK